MPHQFSSISEAARTLPATLTLVALSALGFLLIYMHAPMALISSLTYSDFEISGAQIRFLPSQGQFWRLFTPAFLHFGFLHIVFNSLWLWELGGLVEKRLGPAVMFLLFALVAAGSNTAQYVWSGPSLFGGMSGVVYGLLGFCWLYELIRPGSGLVIPRAILVLMLIWLVFCMVGPTALLGVGSVANAAHLAGLVLGCLLGACLGYISKLR